MGADGDPGEGPVEPAAGWRMLLARRDPLLLVSAALVVVNALHGVDHVRQGLGRLTFEVMAGGLGLLLLALVPLALTLRGHRLAPLAAAVVGLWTVFAVAASHLAPHWSALSDPYADNDLDVVSWSLMLAVIAVAAVLGAIGLGTSRRRLADERPSLSIHN
jgi:hypothetical protein